MVILIGSNPSERSMHQQAFSEDTYSGKRLRNWLCQVGVDTFVTANVYDYPTDNNRPLKASEIRENIPELKRKIHGYDKVVAVGKTAERALEMCGIEFHTIEHPSGCNRKLNDDAYVQKMLSKFKNFCDR